MDVADEKDLAGRLVRMDERAWERFCGLYGPPLLGFVRYALGLDPREAEEVVQMTLVRCVRSIRTFDAGRGTLGVWLRAIARNEAHTVARRDHKTAAEIPQSALAPEIADRILETFDSTPLADEILARRDLQTLVRETLLSLPERQREVLVMKYMDDMTVAEIAERVGSSPKAIESLLTRSREAFRAAFRGMTRDAGPPPEIEIR